MTDAKGQPITRPAGEGRARATARRYPTSTFFVLTFLITWAVWLPRILAPDSIAGTIALLGTYGPAMAAVTAAALIGTFVTWAGGWCAGGSAGSGTPSHYSVRPLSTLYC